MSYSCLCDHSHAASRIFSPLTACTLCCFENCSASVCDHLCEHFHAASKSLPEFSPLPDCWGFIGAICSNLALKTWLSILWNEYWVVQRHNSKIINRYVESFDSKWSNSPMKNSVIPGQIITPYCLITRVTIQINLFFNLLFEWLKSSSASLIVSYG